MKTDMLIRVLTADAARPVIPIGRLLSIALAAGAAASLALFALLLEPRADLPDAIRGFGLTMKIGFAGCLLATAGVSLGAMARPLPQRRILRGLVLAPLLLASAVVATLVTSEPSTWATQLVGHNPMGCLVHIWLLSVVPACLLMLALRRGAPARPGLAGAIAGLAAGALGASLFAFACPEDSLLFVATWYSLAIGTVTALCYCIGRRWLRW